MTTTILYFDNKAFSFYKIDEDKVVNITIKYNLSLTTPCNLNGLHYKIVPFICFRTLGSVGGKLLMLSST